MRALSARAALGAWEQGELFGPQDRALALLQAALPEVSRDRLRQLPIGKRDALLLRLRQRTFGHRVLGLARCASCQAQLEFDIDLRTYAASDQLQHRQRPEWLTVDRFEVLFRLPDSIDFEALADSCLDAGAARTMLIDRCVFEARHDGQVIPSQELSEAAIDRLGERMEELDPLAEMPLAIRCDQCHHRWLALFDVGHFLWHDVAQSAHRLLDEVHTLAMAYGWSEPQILALSAARRKYYLDKAAAKG